MKDSNGFHVDIVQATVPQDMTTIRMNVEDFDEAFDLLTAHGFKNAQQGDKISESPTSKGTSMVSPSGFMIGLSHHFKRKTSKIRTNCKTELQSNCGLKLCFVFLEAILKGFLSFTMLQEWCALRGTLLRDHTAKSDDRIIRYNRIPDHTFTSGFFSPNFSFSIPQISPRSLPCFSMFLIVLYA